MRAQEADSDKDGVEAVEKFLSEARLRINFDAISDPLSLSFYLTFVSSLDHSKLKARDSVCLQLFVTLT